MLVTRKVTSQFLALEELSAAWGRVQCALYFRETLIYNLQFLMTNV